MKKYFSHGFLDYAGERALKTVIQTLLAGGFVGAGLFDLDWVVIGSIAGGTTLASIATSVLLYKGDGTDDPNDTQYVPKHSKLD